mgnify:CR=1 FL=1
MLTELRQALADTLDWLAQHGLDGPTDTQSLMERNRAALARAIEALDVADGLLKNPILVVKSWGMEESQCFACGAEPEYGSGRMRKHKPDCAWEKWTRLREKKP